MITENQFVDWVCIALGDFGGDVKNRARFLLPMATGSIMYAAQWESMTIDRELAVAAGSWTAFPDDIFKAWCMYRSGHTKQITWMPPEEYDRDLAGSSTPYGIEVCRYTVKGSGNLQTKRFYWLDKPTGSYTVQGTFSTRIDTSAIQMIPEQFLDAIKAKVILDMTPKWFADANGQRTANPNYQVVYRDLIRAMGILNSIEGGHMGRTVKLKLDDIGKNATGYMHA